jgi:hypothetical protein
MPIQTQPKPLSEFAHLFTDGRPAFPSQMVDAAGPSGNPWAVMGLVTSLMKQIGVDQAGIDDVMADMKAGGTYEHLMEVAGRWVTILNAHVLDND